MIGGAANADSNKIETKINEVYRMGHKLQVVPIAKVYGIILRLRDTCTASSYFKWSRQTVT